jgi:hypothetical protein
VQEISVIQFAKQTRRREQVEGGKSGEKSATMVTVWEGIKIQSNHLMIFHHNNVLP